MVQQGVPQNVFVKIKAAQLLEAISLAMNSVEPGWNCRNRLTATGSDDASANLGKRHSVAKMLKDQVPHLMAIHCISHRLELGVLNATKERDGKLFADLKSVLMGLHKHYHYSPKALRELEALSDALEEKMTKPVNLLGIMQMPHSTGALMSCSASILPLLHTLRIRWRTKSDLLKFKTEQGYSLPFERLDSFTICTSYRMCWPY